MNTEQEKDQNQRTLNLKDFNFSLHSRGSIRRVKLVK